MLSTIAKVLQGRLYGTDGVIDSFSIDTRTLTPGALFVALAGSGRDGHDYLSAALERGARGALVARRVAVDLPQVLVADPRLGLGRLAAWWRKRHALPLLAVTGSNGKTSVKEMIRQILAQGGQPVLATEGNLNNDLGVPLTLLRLRDTHRFAVIEMGMNHPGEIDYLTRIAQPDVAVITNAAAAHLEGLGSVAAVARAKGEIFAGLQVGGTAVVNADDPHCGLWCELAGQARVVRFGLEQPAEVSARYELLADASVLHLETPWGSGECRLAVPGRHNIMNALAAAAATGSAGIGIEQIAAGLAAWSGVRGRLQVTRIDDVTLIDDSYNANPASMVAAIDVLCNQGGSRVLVIGDMGELGDAAAALHATIGQRAREAGVTQLFCLGPLSREACTAFGPASEHFTDHARLAEALASRLRGLAGPVSVLVKGSRAARMERVVEYLVATLGGGR